MIKCRNCKRLQLSENLYPIIDPCVEVGETIFCILICSCCGTRHVMGGRPYVDTYTGKEYKALVECEYDPKEHADLPKVIGILDFPSVGCIKGNFAIIKVYKPIGTSILSWHEEKYKAKIALSNLRLSDPNFEGYIETKERALNPDLVED